MLKPSPGRERVSAAFDGETPEEITAEGLVRNGLSSTQHTLLLMHGNDRQEQPFQVNPAPKLALFVTDQNLGSLIVDVGHQDAVITIDGRQRQGRKMSANRLSLGLEPKEYLVRVTKEGFYQQEGKVTVKKGELVTFKAPLRPIETLGLLTVRKAAGLDISVGDDTWQQSREDGNLALRPPLGRQTVRIRKPGYRQWEEARDFSVDREVVIDASEINFQALDARVTFRGTPAEAKIRLTGPDGKEIQLTGRVVNLREGNIRQASQLLTMIRAM